MSARIGFGIWMWLWAVAAILAVLGFVMPGVVLSRFWLFDNWWSALVLPLIFVPLVVVALTASARPGRLAGAAAIVASAGVVALGISMQRLLVWHVTREGNWYHGPGGFGEGDYPWGAYQAMALVYAAGGGLLLALLIAALARSRRAASQHHPRQVAAGVGGEDAGSA